MLLGNTNALLVAEVPDRTRQTGGCIVRLALPVIGVPRTGRGLAAFRRAIVTGVQGYGVGSPGMQ